MPTGGKHLVRLAANVKDVKGAVYSETKQVHGLQMPSHCDILMTLLKIAAIFVGGVLVTIIFHDDSSLVIRNQLYMNATVEIVDSTSTVTRMFYSAWRVWECPNQGEQPYGDIVCTAIPAQETKKYRSRMKRTVLPVTPNCMISAGECYLLPYPFSESSPSDCIPMFPDSVIDRYMVEGSRVHFQLKLHPELEYTSSSPFLFLVFSNVTDLSKYFDSGTISNAVGVHKIFMTKPDSPHKPTFVIFTYTVRESSYLHFAFSPPINTTLESVSSLLAVWQYLDWPVGNGKKYLIGKTKTTIPIELDQLQGEKVLCHSSTVSSDRTSICITYELRLFGLLGYSVLGCWVLVVCLVCACYEFCTSRLYTMSAGEFYLPKETTTTAEEVNFQDERGNGSGNHLIKMEDIEIVDPKRPLGKGSYGYAKKVRFDGKIYAGKFFYLGDGICEKAAKKAELLFKLNHENIVQCIGRNFPDAEPFLIMELLPKSLYDYLRENPEPPLLRKLDLLHDVSKGLAYLHKHDVIHCDLTVKNVLLDENGVAKVSDFGNSRMIHLDSSTDIVTMTDCPGNLLYCAPETKSTPGIRSARYNNKIDIFSFGHLSTVVFIKRFDVDLDMGLTKIRKAYQYDLEKMLGDHPIVALIKRCLNVDRNERPSARSVVCELSELCTKQTDTLQPSSKSSTEVQI